MRPTRLNLRILLIFVPCAFAFNWINHWSRYALRGTTLISSGGLMDAGAIVSVAILLAVVLLVQRLLGPRLLTRRACSGSNPTPLRAPSSKQAKAAAMLDRSSTHPGSGAGSCMSFVSCQAQFSIGQSYKNE